ncbi:MAG: CCA tRNA nucleotidyltransferase [Rhizobiaceae bacterium]
MADRIAQDWLKKPSLQALLALLNEGDENVGHGIQARIAGGAVRNALLDQPISDVDIATSLVPRDVILRLQRGGHKAVPTGIEHGTITAVVDGDAYEVTTLRQDVETDGRHARVLYGTDWTADARRRDLTINALYLNSDGTVFDPLGGMQDVLSQNVRFIDDAETRIREDYLRILRFFRFFAWYGSFRPDAEGLKACARLKDGLESLSAERVWHELVKLLAAPDPGRAILWMRQTGVLTKVLPESEKWGIDALQGLIIAEGKHGWSPDPLLRLMSIIPPMPDRISELVSRLKLPNSVAKRLNAWCNSQLPDARLKKQDFYRWLYWQKEIGVSDRLKLEIARDGQDSKKHQRQLRWLARWDRPKFPVRGQDLIDKGRAPGPDISTELTELEEHWVESDFQLSREDLLSRIEKV